ncbi:MAG: L,D-transpeptidase [Kistimonas sp.]|nr:L,D-transpeptidase [Kistimonas sp.]
MSIIVNIKEQTLTLSGRPSRQWSVSTALRGAGQQEGSFQTPLGLHRIRARIGDGFPSRAVFVGRRFTGEVWTEQLHRQYPERDWILGRILWLCGCEPGWNRHGSVDSQRRYIYIHGTPDCTPVGRPESLGCIRMHCDDLLELYAVASVGMGVNIVAGGAAAAEQDERERIDSVG